MACKKKFDQINPYTMEFANDDWICKWPHCCYLLHLFVFKWKALLMAHTGNGSAVSLSYQYLSGTYLMVINIDKYQIGAYIFLRHKWWPKYVYFKKFVKYMSLKEQIFLLKKTVKKLIKNQNVSSIARNKLSLTSRKIFIKITFGVNCANNPLKQWTYIFRLTCFCVVCIFALFTHNSFAKIHHINQTTYKSLSINNRK